jgi:hypothetical protein
VGIEILKTKDELLEDLHNKRLEIMNSSGGARDGLFYL